MKYLQITLKDGTVHVSAFRRLEKISKYVSEIATGKKWFNLWRVVGTELPSGEKTVLRTREMINGEEIVRIKEVKPKADADANEVALLHPPAFEEVVLPAKGERGLWVVPRGLQNDLVPGTVYPLHLDHTQVREYIIVKGQTDTDEEDRYWVDGLGLNGHRLSPGATSGTLPAGGGTQALDDDDDF